MAFYNRHALESHGVTDLRLESFRGKGAHPGVPAPWVG